MLFCRSCNQEFRGDSRSFDLTRHQQEQHSVEQPITYCPIKGCDSFRFFDKKTFDAHMKVEHGLSQNSEIRQNLEKGKKVQISQPTGTVSGLDPFASYSLGDMDRSKTQIASGLIDGPSYPNLHLGNHYSPQSHLAASFQSPLAFPPSDEDSSITANLAFSDAQRDEKNERILGKEGFRRASIPQASTVNANSQDVTTVEAFNLCNVCGESFRSLEGWKAHMEVHKSESLKDYGEPTVSSTEHVKKRHQRTTPEEATHHCYICGKLFMRSHNLKSHMEIHNPERKYPHPCTAMVGNQPCAKKFQRKTDLERHFDCVRLSLVDV